MRWDHQRLRAARQSRGLSVKHVAQLMKLKSENTVRSIEGTLRREGKSARPRPSSVAKYCEVLGLELDDFIIRTLVLLPPSYVDFRSESPPPSDDSSVNTSWRQSRLRISLLNLQLDPDPDDKIAIRSIRLNAKIIESIALFKISSGLIPKDSKYSSILSLEHWVRLEAGHEDDAMTPDPNFWWLGVCYHHTIPTTTQFLLPSTGLSHEAMFTAPAPFITWDSFNRVMSTATFDLEFILTVTYVSQNLGPGSERSRFVVSGKEVSALCAEGLNNHIKFPRGMIAFAQAEASPAGER